MTSPSLDILTRDYNKDGSDAMVSTPRGLETMARAPSTEKEGHRGWVERGNTSRHNDRENTGEKTLHAESRKAKLRKTRTSTTAKKNEGVTQTGDDVADSNSPAGRLPTPKARYTIAETPSGDSYGCCDAVLPVAVPGEARNMVFGATAKAVVLVSGSSRLMVSRCKCFSPKTTLARIP